MKYPIWQRYLIKKFFSALSLFLLSFYGLYILIDYANQSALHRHAQGSWYKIASYYGFVFISRAEILIPIAIVIAFVFLFSTLNSRYELVAFMASGFSSKKLAAPFLFIAIFFVALLYINEQFFLPRALKKLRRFEDATKHKKSRNQLTISAHEIALVDGSRLIYQYFDPSGEFFFDVFWIESMDSIYRMKKLFPLAQPPQAVFVDHFKRSSEGDLFQEESFEQRAFPQLKLQSNFLQSTIMDPDTLSITALYRKIQENSEVGTEKESKLLMAFYSKLAMPWLALLAVLSPYAYVIHFSRQIPSFALYVGSLFGMLLFYLLFDALEVAAKRQVLSPFWATFPLFTSIFLFFFWRFLKK